MQLLLESKLYHCNMKMREASLSCQLAEGDALGARQDGFCLAIFCFAVIHLIYSTLHPAAERIYIWYGWSLRYVKLVLLSLAPIAHTSSNVIGG